MPTASDRELKQLGKYQVVGRLGAGGMSRVYRAVASDLPHAVALKVTPIDNDIDVTIEDYQREVMIGRRLDHPNIVAPIDHGCQSDHIYLVMPVVEGATLSNATRLRDPSRRPSSKRSSAYDDEWCVGFLDRQWQHLAKVGCQLSSALEACHKLGIIHRDIKPGNIIMDRQGDVQLMDFGLAWMRRGPADHELATKAGTARYLPPEIFDGYRDERGDIYSLGLTLHELTTGLKTWGHVSHDDILETRPDYCVPPVREVRPGVPECLAACIDKACQEDPKDRHATASDLLLQFQSAAARLRMNERSASASPADSDPGLRTLETIAQLSDLANVESLTETVWFGDA